MESFTVSVPLASFRRHSRGNESVTASNQRTFPLHVAPGQRTLVGLVTKARGGIVLAQADAVRREVGVCGPECAVNGDAVVAGGCTRARAQTASTAVVLLVVPRGSGIGILRHSPAAEGRCRRRSSR